MLFQMAELKLAFLLELRKPLFHCLVKVSVHIFHVPFQNTVTLLHLVTLLTFVTVLKPVFFSDDRFSRNATLQFEVTISQKRRQ